MITMYARMQKKTQMYKTVFWTLGDGEGGMISENGTDTCIIKLWYIYTMEYYSAIKKNTFESVLMRWMKLEPIIQSEVIQKEKHQYSILTPYSFLGILKCACAHSPIQGMRSPRYSPARRL